MLSSVILVQSASELGPGVGEEAVGEESGGDCSYGDAAEQHVQDDHLEEDGSEQIGSADNQPGHRARQGHDSGGLGRVHERYQGAFQGSSHYGRERGPSHRGPARPRPCSSAPSRYRKPGPASGSLRLSARSFSVIEPETRASHPVKLPRRPWAPRAKVPERGRGYHGMLSLPGEQSLSQSSSPRHTTVTPLPLTLCPASLLDGNRRLLYLLSTYC